MRSSGRDTGETIFLPGIRANPRHLHTSARKFDEILLQRCKPECILNFIIMIDAIITLRIDKKFSVLFEKPAVNTVACKNCIAEITFYG